MIRKKHHATKYKVECCRIAIKAKENGINHNETAKTLGIANTTLHNWIINYETGVFDSEIVIPEELVSGMVELFNGVITEEVDVLVFCDDLKNSILVTIEKPLIDEIEAFNKEVDIRILEKLKWCFAQKGVGFKK